MTETEAASQHACSPRQLLWRRIAACAAVLSILAGFLFTLSRDRFIDHDLFHQIALWREALRLGGLPLENIYSYTPSVYPHVHHEWGFGALMYYLIGLGGAAAIAVTRDILLAAIMYFTMLCARRRGATWLMIAALLVAVLPLTGFMVSAVRAQIVTLAFVAILLNFIELDRAGRRWWIWVWVPMYVLWLNLHGGFVVGPLLLGAYWLETVIRTRKPHWRLVALGTAMGPLMLVNPYGWDYLPYMWRALTMPRPDITEWRPLWEDPIVLAVHLFMLILLAYAMFRRGWRNTHGVLILVFAAFESLMHIRHMSLFLVIWLSAVPALLSATPLRDVLDRHWARRAWVFALFFGSFAAMYLVSIRDLSPTVRLSVSHEEKRGLALPVGAAEYMEDVGFEGNVMTPFNGSAFLMWRSYPDVKIAMDSRYEAAYPEEVFQDVARLYRGRDGWQETLVKYPPDLILVPVGGKLEKKLPELPEWRPVYLDDGFQLYARPGLDLPYVDRRGQPIDSSFPRRMTIPQ